MTLTVYQYSWEQNADDNSLMNSINSYIPSPTIVEAFDLHSTPIEYGTWLNGQNEVIFQDPSVIENGSGYALIDAIKFFECLDTRGLELIWFIGGEKQLHHSEEQGHKVGVDGRYTFNFAFVKEERTTQIYFKDKIEHWKD